VQFLLLGACIYALYGWTAPPDELVDSDRRIVITAGEVSWLEENWRKRWGRPPTPLEREGLVREFLKETMLYREAVAMGLDDNDTIIRRRLAQKLGFLIEDLIQPETPSAEDLKQWFEAHEDEYREPDLFTVSQVFFDPDKRDAEALTAAEALVAKLNTSGELPERPGAYGDPFMLQDYYPERPESELAKLFGAEFARSVVELELGRWHGPILSGYGVHVVYVSARRRANDPVFADVEEQVRKDWLSTKRAELNERYIEGLFSRYEVVIEDVADAPADAGGNGNGDAAAAEREGD